MRIQSIGTSLGTTMSGRQRPWRLLASTEAIRYVKDAKVLNDSLSATAELCEGALPDSHTPQKLRIQYAVVTYLATFKATVKKVPGQPRETILCDLVASQPGQEGKWFAAAKDAGLFELAIELANRSPSDPRTLIRAARDFAVERPEFALAAGMTGLRGIANGWGYDITGIDVLDAYAAVLTAAGAAGVDETVVKADVRALIARAAVGASLWGVCWRGSWPLDFLTRLQKATQQVCPA